MPADQDPKWEVVDEIPGERKPRPSKANKLLRSRGLWIGMAVAVAAVLAVPALRIMLMNLARSWWLLAALSVLWYWQRLRRASRRRR